MIKVYWMTYLALLALLALTLAEYAWQVLPFGFGVSLLIGAAKAGLIAIVFMELKNASNVIRFTVYAGLLWIFIFYGLSSLDLFFRPGA